MIFTETMNVTMPASCRKFLQIGCILPDILVHTYLMGHTWDASGKKVLRKLEKLEDWGILTIWSSLRFGMILHYLEDYFTMAHSRYFKGDILDHIHYETNLMNYMKELYQSENNTSHSDISHLIIQSADELFERIVLLQNAYQQEIATLVDNESMCFETDLKYMNMVVQSVIEYVVPLMNKKTIVYRKLVGEAMTRMPQEYSVLQ